MSCYALRGNARFDNVVISCDKVTKSLSLLCFEHGKGDWPAVWHPKVQTLQELRQLVSAYGLVLPSLTSRILFEELSGRTREPVKGGYVYLREAHGLSLQSHRVLKVERSGERCRVLLAFSDGSSRWLDRDAIAPNPGWGRRR